MKKNKKLAVLVVTCMLTTASTVTGATYALFTDSAQSGNSFTAGTVNIDIMRDMGDTIPGPMFYDAVSDPTGYYPYDTNKNAEDAPPGGEAIGGWAPGDRITRAMNIFNRGSLDVRVKQLKARLNIDRYTTRAAYTQFAEKMKIKVIYPAQGKILYNGPLSHLLYGYVPIPSFIIAGDPSGPANITFEAYLDKSADNTLQGSKFLFDFEFYAEQRQNNT